VIDPIQAIGASIDPRAARLAAAVAPRADGATTDASPKDDAAHTATRKVAQDFTSLLVGTLVREMFQSVSESENGPFGDGPGADVYKGLAENAFAESLAKHGLDALTDRVHEVIARHATPGSPAIEGARPAMLHALDDDRLAGVREETR